jgi:hypothetical protein
VMLSGAVIWWLRSADLERTEVQYLVSFA